MSNNTQPRQVTLWQEQAAKLSGLTFGGVDTDGVQWVLTDISGFYDIDLEGETGARAWRDGDWVGKGWIRGHRFTVKITIKTDENRPELITSAVEAVKRALPVRAPAALVVQDRGQVTAEDVICEDKVTVTRWRTAAHIEIPLLAPNPVRYAADWETGQVAWEVFETGLPKRTGGLHMPFTAPFIIKSETVAGELRFIVGGSARPLSQIIISGPVKNPVVRDAVAGWRVAVNLDIAAGERLVIDPTARTVELNGASRRGAISGGFPVIDVGEHLITWSADSFSPDARLKIRVAESYL